MLCSLVFESLSLWPLALAIGAVLTLAVLWLYPAQVRTAGFARWFPPLLRWLAVAALTLSILKPVVLQPKSAEQWGSVVVLVDCSRSMSVVDTGRSISERVALAGALGRLPPGARSRAAIDLGSALDRLESRQREVVHAMGDLDYARVSGRGLPDVQTRLTEAMARCTEAAKAIAAQSAAAPAGSDLRQQLQDLGSPPPSNVTDRWVDDFRRRIDRARTALTAFQSAADEQLYKTNPAVRSDCDALAKASRLDIAKEALLRPGAGLLSRLGGQIPVIGLAVGRDLSPITLTRNGQPVPRVSIAADADESDLAGAVTAALSGLSHDPVRAVVLLSDGRQVGGHGDVISSVRPSGVPVFTVGVAATRTPDLSISSISLPAVSAFSGETIEGHADVSDDGGLRPPSELHVASSQGEQIVKLTPRAKAGTRDHGQEWVARFAVKIAPPAGAAAERITFSVPPAPGEVTLANNQIDRWIKVSSDKLRVALCTAAPDWDYESLRSTLARRAWVRLESEVLDPERPRFSMSPRQILEQDVLILSDVPVTALDVNQWDAVRSLLTSNGGSVILIAGQTYPIADYATQPIARTLLPFHDVRPTWKEWPGEQPAFHFAPTPLGEREALLLGGGIESAARRWQELPGIYRFLQIPDGSLLPDVQPLLLESEGHSPVLTERRLGAGRVLFLGLDETWRWRQQAGPRDADVFWRQLVRRAAGEPYAASQGPLALDVDKVSAAPGEAVHVRARARGAKVPAPKASSCPVSILSGGKVISTRQLGAIGGGHFAGQIADLPQGDYQLEIRGAAADGAPVSVRVPLHIAQSDEAEMRDISGDPTMLTRLARSSGGQYLPIEQVDALPERLNALHETEARFIRRPLWNSPLLFGFVLACFAGEWALRKRFGLA